MESNAVEHLYTPSDVQKIRKKLLEEQCNRDKMTGLDIPEGKDCLDHNHRTQFVRGVLHRQSNASLGKLEGIYTRYLSYWYPWTLSEFLRQAASYIELEDDSRYVHPGWIKRLCTDFASLNEQGKKDTLEKLCQPIGSNATERKVLFRKALLTRKFSYNTVKDLINQKKGIK